MRLAFFLLVLPTLILPPAPVFSQELDHSLLTTVNYRNLGPYRTGAWVADFAVPENGREHAYTFYVAMRSGGVWKTSNNGTTFTPVFDGNGVQAIGDVTVAPSDNDIVWVGTGDNANARSSHSGTGVFKSVDGGQSWRHMGLSDSHHIARIVIHPSNPDIVYIAVIGHLFSANEERGIFRSRDGGESWEKVLYISDSVGAVDIVLDRNNPDVLYAASYDMKRRPWLFEAGGPESAIFKSIDGGNSWSKLGSGLPEGVIGRIGLDIYRGDSNVIYAVFENLNLREPTKEEREADREESKKPQQRPYGGEVYRSDDAGASWQKVNRPEVNVGGKAPYSFNQIFVDPNDDEKIFVTSEALANSVDGGATWQDIDWPAENLFANNFGDVRTFWIDPQDSDRMLFGSDGGVYISYDGGKTSDHLYNLPTGEVYAVGVDMTDPYNIYAGLQDHESWKGPVNSWSGAVTLEDWVVVGLWDGMYNQVDPTDSRRVYTTAQFGGHRRVDQQNGTRQDIQPAAAEGDNPMRFPWTPAIQISPHDTNVLYAGSSMLLRSPDRGKTWQEISPDLTHQTMQSDGGNCADAGGAQGWINFCTITSHDESMLQPGLIWAGTDDGRVHVTEDAGQNWREVTGNLLLAGAPEEFWVSRVRASKHASGVAYVTKNGFRFDRFEPHVYRTTDFGKSWTLIAADLPQSPVNVIFEDGRNPQLLYLGNDRGVYASIDRGANWTSLRTNMPVVPVKDLVVHPRENDLIVGTYGRGLYVADISVLQELSSDLLEKNLHLFDIESRVIRRSERKEWGAYHMSGDRHLATENEPAGLTINYYLKESFEQKTRIAIHDATGNEVATLEGGSDAGVNQLQWDTAEFEDVRPGIYRITVSAGDFQHQKFARLLPPRAFSIGQIGDDLSEDGPR
ncbi:MAG: FlgD immunoglobulin-like domain containing protein [Woeseiaceae bacterium]